MDMNEAIRLLNIAARTLEKVSFGETLAAPETLRKIVYALERHAIETADGACLKCGKSLTQPETGRPRVYCSDRCRKAAHRAARQR
jgi:hypothetical protein